MVSRKTRAVRPGLERCEGRQLLSGLTAMMVAAQPRPSAVQLLTRRLTTVKASASVPGMSGNTQPNGNGFNNNDASPLLGNGFPTARELAREQFKAVFPNGRYYTGPGRFTDQGTTYFYRGLGGSNMFLHGDFNMAVVTPVDPSSPFIGEAVLQDKNVNSAAIIGLILKGDRTAVDALGRPTHLTFTADPNIYSGPFSVAAAEGTVDIRYGAGSNKPVSVVFNGRVYTSGLSSPLVNQDLYARHGRPLRFRGA